MDSTGWTSGIRWWTLQDWSPLHQLMRAPTSIRDDVRRIRNIDVDEKPFACSR
ncbi:hypothetical protein BamMEX5DRAFT_2469 [Burkholderia ambifaria MEX-5]|uniref:Uncharacterized protein n=1 Tax=Burkholderia ambifaria MEX-5 TaxID=396597 RepID=B1T3V3_9BURK|nr:hypothetical protein BamMEX5DRAFT_2469 [Burkholderia ambifaria MEX-5]